MKPIISIPIGDNMYLIYPPALILFFIVFFAIAGSVAVVNILKNKKKENTAYKYYEITDWQRNKLMPLVKRHNKIEDAYRGDVEWIQSYINKNKYWNIEEILEDAPSSKTVMVMSIYMLEAAIGEYSLEHFNNAVLILHAVDFLNGGMDGDIYDGDYQWIGDEIDSLKNHTDMTDEEARTLYLYASAVINLIDLCDEDLEKIPDEIDVEPFCKTLSLTDMELAADELDQVVDIHNEGISDETRDVVSRGLFNNISILLAEILDDDDVKFMDEYRRYTLRALVACIDKQPYSEFIETVE